MTYTSNIASNNEVVKPFSFNFAEAIKFLRAVYTEDVDICFQTFDDDKGKKHNEKDNSLKGNWYATASMATMQRLAELNKRGAGIYFTVNATDGKGRKDENITGITALFIDMDGKEPARLDELPPPSAIIQSKNGKHVWWFMHSGEDLGQFEDYQHHLADMTGGDHAMADIARVLRLPGFNHMKNPNDPYLVQLLELHPDRRYRLSDFPKPEYHAPVKRSKAVTGKAANVTGNMDDLNQKLSDYLAIAPKHSLTGAKKQRTIARAKAKLAEGSRLTGTANDTMLDTGIIAAELLTKGKETPETLVDQLFNLAKAQYGNEDKGYEWDELEARATIIRGLAYGVLSRHNDLLSASTTLTDAITTEVQYVSDMGIDLDAAKVTVINSPIGTGKTTFIKQAIIAALKANANDYTIRILCHRTALVDQWAKELGQLGFLVYSDEKGLKAYHSVGAVPLFITTYDSLPRMVGSWKADKGMVILDEVDQAIKYLYTCRETTISHQRNLCHDVLKVLLQTADTVIATSATASDLEVGILVNLTGSDSVQKYVNKVKPYHKSFTKLNIDSEALSTVDQALGLGQPTYVACDTRKNAEAVAEMMSKKYPDIKVACITSASKDNYELSDINTLVQKYHLVVASPTIGTGVDISCQYFHTVVGLFTYSDIAYQECLQAVGRVRYPLGKVHVYIDDQYVAAKDEKTIRDEFNMDVTACQALTIGFTVVESKTVPVMHPDTELIKSWQIEYIQKENQDCQNRASKFWMAVADQGHNIEYTEVEETVASDALKETAEALKQQRAEAVANAEVLTSEQVKAITAKSKKRSAANKVTDAEKLAKDRYFVSIKLYPQQQGQAAVTADEVLYAESTKGKKTLNLYKLLRMTPEAAMLADQIQTDITGTDGGYDGKFFTRDKQNLERLVAALQPVLQAERFTQYDLDGFMAVLRDIGVAEARKLNFRVDPKDASSTVADLLRSLEFTVERKKTRNVLAAQASTLKEEARAERTEGQESGYVFHIYRTPAQSDLVNRLTQPNPSQLTKELFWLAVDALRLDESTLTTDDYDQMRARYNQGLPLLPTTTPTALELVTTATKG